MRVRPGAQWLPRTIQSLPCAGAAQPSGTSGVVLNSRRPGAILIQSVLSPSLRFGLQGYVTGRGGSTCECQSGSGERSPRRRKQRWIVLSDSRPPSIVEHDRFGRQPGSCSCHPHPATIPRSFSPPPKSHFLTSPSACPLSTRQPAPSRPTTTPHHTTPQHAPPAIAADDSARATRPRALHAQPPSAVALATVRNVSPARTRWLTQLPRLACSTLNPLSLSALRTPWRHQGLATDLALLALMGRTPTRTATYHPPARRRDLPPPLVTNWQLEPFSFRRARAYNW